MSIREDLVKNAVGFLKDPQASTAPLEKKIEFLESKGLTKEEIDESIKRSQDPTIPSTSTSELQEQTPKSNNHSPSQGYIPQQHQQYYSPPPPAVPDRDWKDYFIMATATVGVGYALYEITKRYIVPNILPESKTKLEQDKESIDAEFARIEGTLKSISDTNEELKENELKKSKEIFDTIKEVDDVLQKSREKNEKIEHDLKFLKSEVENLKNSLDKAIEKQQDSISNEVNSIQLELKSLQQLIKSKSSLASEIQSSSVPGSASRSSVPPASSIPSASEILKNKNFAKSAQLPATTTITPSSSSSTHSEPVTGSASGAKPDIVSSPEPSTIPSWQQAAATPEIASTQPASAPSSNASSPSNLPVSSNIPAWQRQLANNTATKKIPAWQHTGMDLNKDDIPPEEDPDRIALYEARKMVGIPQDQKFIA